MSVSQVQFSKDFQVSGQVNGTTGHIVVDTPLGKVLITCNKELKATVIDGAFEPLLSGKTKPVQNVVKKKASPNRKQNPTSDKTKTNAIDERIIKGFTTDFEEEPFLYPVVDDNKVSITVGTQIKDGKFAVSVTFIPVKKQDVKVWIKSRHVTINNPTRYWVRYEKTAGYFITGGRTNATEFELFNKTPMKIFHAFQRFQDQRRLNTDMGVDDWFETSDFGSGDFMCDVLRLVCENIAVCWEKQQPLIKQIKFEEKKKHYKKPAKPKFRKEVIPKNDEKDSGSVDATEVELDGIRSDKSDDGDLDEDKTDEIVKSFDENSDDLV